jgi:hypothetical protein
MININQWHKSKRIIIKNKKKIAFFLLILFDVFKNLKIKNKKINGFCMEISKYQLYLFRVQSIFVSLSFCFSFLVTTVHRTQR